MADSEQNSSTKSNSTSLVVDKRESSELDPQVQESETLPLVTEKSESSDVDIHAQESETLSSGTEMPESSEVHTPKQTAEKENIVQESSVQTPIDPNLSSRAFRTCCCCRTRQYVMKNMIRTDVFPARPRVNYNAATAAENTAPTVSYVEILSNFQCTCNDCPRDSELVNLQFDFTYESKESLDALLVILDGPKLSFSPFIDLLFPNCPRREKIKEIIRERAEAIYHLLPDKTPVDVVPNAVEPEIIRLPEAVNAVNLEANQPSWTSATGDDRTNEASDDCESGK